MTHTPHQPPITTGRPQLPPHQRMTRAQGEALAHLTHTLKPTWDTTGIITAITPLVPHIPPTPIALALIHATQHPKATTPHAIHYPGPWWPPTTPTQRHPDPCPIEEHAALGKYAHNCPECRLLGNFPSQLDAATYHRLDPKVQAMVDKAPGVVVLT